jgi:hypothetical protein
MRFCRIIRSVLVGCFSVLSISAQNRISVGVKGGIPFTDPFTDRAYNLVIATIPNPFGPPRIASQTTSLSTGSSGFLLGPTLEVQLPFSVAFEADALYRPISVKVQSTSFLPGLTLNAPALFARTDTWEFPFLAKYRLSVPLIKPYVAAGPNFRTTSGSLARQMSTRGVSVGVGVESRVGKLRIAPEIRYTHWGNDGSYNTPYHAASYPNEIKFLAGLSTDPSGSERPLVEATGWRARISFGLKGGLPFTGAFVQDEFGKVNYPPVRCGDFGSTECTITGTVQTFSASRNYLLGPMVEVHLPLGLSIEGDALYHPLSLAVPADPAILQLPSITSFNFWEFPIVGKYKFRSPFARPYLEAGPSFRTASSVYSRYLASAGVTAGLGVEASAWRVHIAPEVRFIHWGRDASDAGLFYASKRNQAEFLVGLSY